MEKQRLNKYLAKNHGLSRRQADDLISSGKVLINDKKAVIGQPVRPDDVVKIGPEVIGLAKTTLIAFHKPVGFVCSRRQQGESETIYALLPPGFQNLKTVGRLDRDSSGLILLTNDGDLSHQMTHPSFHKIKQYEATLDQPLQPLHQQIISDFGIDLEDGHSQLTLTRLHDGDGLNWQITMSEGRNRQIRRTFLALGYTVTKLHRTHFGNYSLGDIRVGEYQIIDIA